MVIRDYPQTIKIGYEGGHERKGCLDSTQNDELVMMKALKMYLILGMGTEGGRIWAIIARDGTINVIMGIMVIYPTKVAKATTCTQRSIRDGLLSSECELWVEEELSVLVRRKSMQCKMAPPQGGLGKPWGSMDLAGSRGKGKDNIWKGKRVATWAQL